MNLHSQHLATILKVYPKAILTPIILGKVSSACSEISKEYAKGFAEWVGNRFFNTLNKDDVVWRGRGKQFTTDQLLALYEDHLEKEKIK